MPQRCEWSRHSFRERYDGASMTSNRYVQSISESELSASQIGSRAPTAFAYDARSTVAVGDVYRSEPADLLVRV